MTTYEVIITPTYTTEEEIQFTVILDNSKFVVDTSKATGVTVSGNKYTITIPSGTSGGYHTKIYLYDNPDDEYTPDLDDAVISDETTIDQTITGSTTSKKYNYKSKVIVKGYTISYYIDNDLYLSENHAFGVTLTPPDDPEEKEGYTFSGWNDVPSVMPAKNVTITSTYYKNAYNLIYKVDGTLYSEYLVEYGDAITPEETPSKEGHTFSGWSDIPDTMPANDVTVTGSFTINQYTLNLIVDGSVVFTTTADYGSTIDYSSLVTPSKTGYRFDGWSSKLPTTMPSSNVEITAKFTQLSYSITYKDGTKVLNTVSGLRYGDPIETYDVPSKVGYTSNGWDTEIPSTMPDHNIVANAQYTINSHNVYYYVDYGNGAGVELAKEYDNITYESEVPVYSYGDIEGYTKGDIVDSDGNKYTVPSVMPDNDIKAYVTYTINEYTLSYTIDGVTTTKTYKFGETIEVPELPQKTGYDASWSEEFPTKMVSRNLNITAVYTIHTWTLKYVIDSVTVKEGSVDYGTVIVPYTTGKTGYTFSGWLDETGNTIEEPVTMPDEDVVLYGYYTINKHSVTYVSSSEILEEYKDIAYGTPSISYTYKGTEPTIYGYKFNGWNITIPSTMPDEDLYIQATFIVNRWSVLFIASGKTISAVTSIPYGSSTSSIKIPEQPEVEGYTSLGWEELPETMPNNNVTINALYEINSYELTYNILKEGDTEYSVYSSETYEYNSVITPISYTPETGYSFDGWKDIPSKMPANDVSVSGDTTHIQYTITYVISSTTAGTQTYFYNDTITALTAETKEGYTFEWKNLPEKMPNKDLTIEGVYTEISDDLKLLYTSVLTTEVSSLDYTKMSSIDVKEGNEYVVTVQTPYVEEPDDDATVEEWEAYDALSYATLFAFPSSLTSIDIINNITNTSILSKYTNNGEITVDGQTYNLYVRDEKSGPVGNELTIKIKL